MIMSVTGTLNENYEDNMKGILYNAVSRHPVRICVCHQ